MPQLEGHFAPQGRYVHYTYCPQNVLVYHSTLFKSPCDVYTCISVFLLVYHLRKGHHFIYFMMSILNYFIYLLLAYFEYI